MLYVFKRINSSFQSFKGDIRECPPPKVVPYLKLRGVSDHFLRSGVGTLSWWYSLTESFLYPVVYTSRVSHRRFCGRDEYWCVLGSFRVVYLSLSLCDNGPGGSLRQDSWILLVLTVLDQNFLK